MKLSDMVKEEKWLLIGATAVPIGLVVIIVAITQLGS